MKTGDLTGFYTGVHHAYLNEDVVVSRVNKVIHILMGSRKRTEGHTNLVETYMVEKFAELGLEPENHYKIDPVDGVSK